MAKKLRLSIGDQVQLLSGGPTMTVTNAPDEGDIDEGGNVRCSWFSGKKLEGGYFPPKSLKVVTAEPDNAKA